MQWNDHTNICTYRVREGARSEFVELLRKHWPALHDAGLATETPAIHFEAVPSAKKDTARQASPLLRYSAGQNQTQPNSRISFRLSWPYGSQWGRWWKRAMVAPAWSSTNSNR